MKNGKMPVIDADSHVFEPTVIWEKYLDPAYRVAARSAFYYHEDEFARRRDSQRQARAADAYRTA